MHKLKNALKLLALAFFLGGCGLIVLPQPTESGKNTIGCKIDGKPFQFKYKARLFGGYFLGGYLNPDSSFYLWANTDPHRIALYVKKLKTEGNYQLSNPVVYGEYSHYNTTSTDYYSTNSTGTLTITHLDFANKIVSGTFDFTAEDKKNGKKVKITKGRFDVDFNNLKK
jgi:hypothetical protein